MLYKPVISNEFYMIKKMSIYWLISLLTLSSLLLCFFLVNDNDEFHCSITQIDEFNSAYKEIDGKKFFQQKKKENKITSNQSEISEYIFNLESNEVWIDESDFKFDSLPNLSVLFTEKLIEALIIRNNGAIIFKLKQCNFLDCENHTSGFTGPYTHYLTKDKSNRFIDYPNNENQRLIEKEKIGGWNYYIEWRRKG